MRPLVQIAPKTNHEDFEKLVSPYLQSLHSYCHYVTRSKWDAEDLMQETLVKLYQRSTKQHIPMSKAYLHRIASNAWIDRVRKKKVDEVLTDHEIESIDKHQPVSSATALAINVLLKTCTPKQRVVFMLVDAFNYSAQEAAHVLGETEGAVKANLHRARKNIKKQKVAETEVDESLISAYSTVLIDGDVNKIIRMYQQDMQASMSSQLNNDQSIYSIQMIGGTTLGYALACIILRSGQRMYIPIYQKTAYKTAEYIGESLRAA